MSKELLRKADAYKDALYSLTVLREINDEEVMRAFYSLVKALGADNCPEAMRSYHKMTYALIAANPRRVSGNIFIDYLTEWIITHEHEFAKRSAQGIDDSICRDAFCHDLALIFTIAKFDTAEAETLISSTTEMRESDSIKAISSAVWGGGLTGGGVSKAVKLLSWRYSLDQSDENYAADDYLAVVYEAFMRFDTDGAADAFRTLFEMAGTGAFLRYRLMTVRADNELRGAYALLPKYEMLPFIYADEYDRLERMIKEYADTGIHTNILLSGARGLGKTVMAMTVAENIPGLCFIYASAYSMPDMSALLDRLSRQPLLFVVIADDVEDAHSLNMYLGTHAQPDNVSILCISDSESSSQIFDAQITLRALDSGAIAKYICDISASPADPDTVRNMCMDYQIENKKQLSYRSVIDILKQINA